MDVSRFDKRRLFVACCALGFASFKVAQSSLYSTAMLTSETTTVLIAGLDFSIASAAFVVLTEAVIVALALLGRLPRLSMPVVAPSLVLAATAVLSYSGALSSVDPAVSLMALAFAQGTATVMLTLAWVEIMTQMELTTSMKTLASSMLLAAAVTLALQNSPSLVMLPCVVATLVASALLYRRAKGIAGNALASGKTMGGDEAAAGAEQKRDRTSLRPYLRGFVSIGEGLLSLLVLGCVVGIINGFMVVQHYDFDGSSLASAMGIAAASMAFFVMAYGFPKTFSASRAYRALFPLLTGVLIIWPFANFQYSYFVGAAFVAGHSLISTSVMYLIIREAHESDLNPYAFMGASVLLIRLASVSGIVGGTVIAGLDLNPSFKTMLVFCIALYLLSIVLLFMLRIRKRSEREQRPAASGEPVRGEDAFDAKGTEVTVRHGLTDRESEILLLLARGRSSTYIGEALYLSPNTVRGHIKNIYAKLGVHSKQEIIDLFTA